jgi:hypothetical protein
VQRCLIEHDLAVDDTKLRHEAGPVGASHFAFRRTLPYFPRGETDPAARGFVANSYMGGMTVPENISQGMNGRFDLISKALSTACGCCSTGLWVNSMRGPQRTTRIRSHGLTR